MGSEINSQKHFIILSSGMPRSGSTWLYNAARLILLNSQKTHDLVSFGWIGDLDSIPKKKIMLIKIHSYDISWVKKSQIILYSYRDIRDALASAKRKFEQQPSIERADAYILQYKQWKNEADFIMRYESMLNDPLGTLEKLASTLNIKDVKLTEILTEINSLSYQSTGIKNEAYNMENLLHKGHITNGSHGSWKGYLDDVLVKQIEDKFRDWFIENKYEISHCYSKNG